MLKRGSSTVIFLWILEKFSEHLFCRTSRQLLLTFHCNVLIKKNILDVSTIVCVVFFGNFADICRQSSLFLTLEVAVYFKYLKSHNKQCYRKHFHLSHIQTSCFFLLRCCRIVMTNLFKNTLLQWKFVYI